ncbi:MAG: hypothetical protein WKF58_04060 [Ilumatobacteraceae bacterium]
MTPDELVGWLPLSASTCTSAGAALVSPCTCAAEWCEIAVMPRDRTACASAAARSGAQVSGNDSKFDMT